MKFLPFTECIPDGEAHVMPDGRLYLYGSLDRHTDSYCSDRYVVASTDDMVRWEISPVRFSANAARLNADMTSIDQTSIVTGILTEKEHHFHEGSSMRKRGDLYYYVFADVSRGKPTCLGYATSHSPLGPFTYQGVIVDNSRLNPESWNNHGSIEEFGGQWYVFFHVSTDREYMRCACCAPIEFDEEGRIREVILQ